MTSLVFLAGLLMASPSLYAALTGTGDVDAALLHLVLALAVAYVGARVLREIVAGYEQPAEAAAAETEAELPARRRTDGPLL